ncbi:MAG: hypothetical protein Q8O30_10195 [Candidatus Omnitrophota bacterium]|nr:hypothetical protein [Candidatus Omnitrophota bacterium]
MKKWLFLIVGILILSSFPPQSGEISPLAEARAEEPAEAQRAKAGDFTLSGYTEVGKRSTAEDYEEEGTDQKHIICALSSS